MKVYLVSIIFIMPCTFCAWVIQKLKSTKQAKRISTYITYLQQLGLFPQPKAITVCVVSNLRFER
jgi:membrane-anchored protein YejM (alkaline phosphatase superfamily)